MFDNVLVQDWMTSPVMSVSPHQSISSAHKIMKEHGVRRLTVLEDDTLAGIITIGDVREASPSDATTLSIWELNYLWSQLIVEKIMTRKVLTVHPETPILDAAELMLDQKVSGLPVVNEQNRVVGIITESDIFRMLVTSRNKVSA